MAQAQKEAEKRYFVWLKGELKRLNENLGLVSSIIDYQKFDLVSAYFMLDAIEHKQEQEFEKVPLGYVPSYSIYSREKTASLINILKGKKRLVITGAPGSGKTTSLLYLASLLLEQHKTVSNGPFEKQYVPIFLQLKGIPEDFKQVKTLKTILNHHLLRCGLTVNDGKCLLDSLLESKRLWLLLDGLDEVPTDQFQDLSRLIHDWLVSNDDVPIIITSRPSGERYRSVLGDEWLLPEYRLHPLKTDQDAITFAAQWLKTLGAPNSDQNDALLIEAMKDRGGATRCLRSPLLLRMVVEVFVKNNCQVDKLPKSRSEIYEEYIKGPVLEQAKIQTFKEFSLKKMYQMLEHIAYTLHGARKTLSQVELQENIGKYLPADIKWDTWFDFISQNMRLMYAAKDQSNKYGGWHYAFSHRTFQEFFTARILSNLWKKSNRGRRWVWCQVLRDRLWDPHWEEVILLLGSQVAAGDYEEHKVVNGDWLLNKIFREKDHVYLELLASCLGEGIQCKNESEEKYFSVLKSKDFVHKTHNRFLNKILNSLKVENKIICRNAADALGEIGDVRAVDALLDALMDEDKAVRLHAADALGKIGDDRVLDALLGALKKGNKVMRRGAAFALGRKGDSRAVSALLAALKYEDEGVCRNAVDALGEIGDARAVDALLADLNDEDKGMRRSVAIALGRIGNARAIDGLRVALKKEDDKYVLWSIADALQEIEGACAMDISLFVSKDEYQSWNIENPLARIGNSNSIDDLLAAYKDGDDDMRLIVVDSLGKIGGVRAVDALIAALKDKNKDVCRHAAEALGKIGDAHAVDAMLAALNDKDIHRSAAGALARIGYNPQLPDPVLPISFLDYFRKMFGQIIQIIKKFSGSLITGLVTALTSRILAISIDKSTVVNVWPGIAQYLIDHPLRSALYAVFISALVTWIMGEVKKK